MRCTLLSKARVLFSLLSLLDTWGKVREVRYGELPFSTRFYVGLRNSGALVLLSASFFCAPEKAFKACFRGACWM